MASLYKKALQVEFFNVGYNMGEAVVAILAGKAAESIALIGFGFDSIVESLSGFILIWRLSRHGKISGHDEKKIEHVATKFVGITFFVLAVYITFESVRKILLREIPDPSFVGILLAIASLVIMPMIAHIKLRIAKKIGLRSLVADSKETFVCSLLSAALLVGLLTNYFFDFWLSDPLVGLIISGYLIYEGRELLFE
jgi:divalent metal cation (Fe/Co/Zn/Cd) transporter